MIFGHLRTILNIKFLRFPRCAYKLLSHLPKKTLNFTYAFKCYQNNVTNKNVSWPHFSWATLCMYMRPEHMICYSIMPSNNNNAGIPYVSTRCHQNTRRCKNGPLAIVGKVWNLENVVIVCLFYAKKTAYLNMTNKIFLVIGPPSETPDPQGEGAINTPEWGSNVTILLTQLLSSLSTHN